MTDEGSVAVRIVPVVVRDDQQDHRGERGENADVDDRRGAALGDLVAASRRRGGARLDDRQRLRRRGGERGRGDERGGGGGRDQPLEAELHGRTLSNSMMQTRPMLPTPVQPVNGRLRGKGCNRVTAYGFRAPTWRESHR
ncbi:MAG: hypothetical protein EOP68_17495, partial [Sphingomonas sp.]